MSPANALNRGVVELHITPCIPKAMQGTNFCTATGSSTSVDPASKSIACGSTSPSKIICEVPSYSYNAKTCIPKDKVDVSRYSEKNSILLCSAENVNTREKNQKVWHISGATFAETAKIGFTATSNDSTGCDFYSKEYATAATNPGAQARTFQSSKLQACNVSFAYVQTDPPVDTLSHQQLAISTMDEAPSTTSIYSPSRSLEKPDDEISTRAVTSLGSLSFEEVVAMGQKDNNDIATLSNVHSEDWSLRNLKPTDVQHFMLRFPNTDDSLLLRDEDVIEQFEYFLGITEGNFCESKTQIIEMSPHLPFYIVKLVLQPKGKLLSSIKKENVCSVIEALDYLGFKYSDDFVHQLFRKIHRHGWTEEKSLSSDLVRACAYTNIGVHLMTYLRRSPGVILGLICKEGGHFIAEMCEKNADRTISLLNDICHNLCSCRPDFKDVLEFLIAATQQETLVDALAEIWDPTLWYSTEKKTISKNAMSDGPHQVGDVDVELYADSDNLGSSTTVNICMSGGSPLDGTTPLSQVTNVGIYASTRSKATYVYTCFTARAKFKLKDFLLGEATFDLYPDGVKAFCPVVSGGPHMHGLQLTCRIDDKIKGYKDEYRSRYSADIGIQRIDDISVELKSRQFPFRGLSLYLLHNAVLQGDFQFVTRFASALQSDVGEWLGTYLTPLWVQQSFPDHSYTYIAPSHLNFVPSPFLILQHWFADARVPIDTWCSKTIMGELFQSNHFQLLMSRHFSDCLNFIKSAKKWIDSESLLLFREKVIEFVSHKPHIVGALLFDLASETVAAHPTVFSHSRRLPESVVDQVATKESQKRCGNLSLCVSSTVPTLASLPMRRHAQQLSCGAPRQSSQNSVYNLVNNRSLTNRQIETEAVHSPLMFSGKSKEPEGKLVYRGAPSCSSGSLQVNGKHIKGLEDVLKEMENMDWGLPDWLDSTKEGTNGKSKRCRLC